MAITLILRWEFVERISSKDIDSLRRAKFDGIPSQYWWRVQLSPKCTKDNLRIIRETFYYKILAPEGREYYVSELRYLAELMHKEEWLRLSMYTS